MKVGIIGTGNIASYLLEQVNERHQYDGEIIAIFGRNEEVGPKLSERFHVDFYTDLTEFLSAPLDLVIEAATVEAATSYIRDVVNSQKDVIVSSIGVFKDIELLDELQSLAKTNNVQVYLPSGAIGGLDLLKSANAVNGLQRVQITTRKSPASLGLENIQEEDVVFEGSAREAIQRFPKNVNVAIVLSLAGLGMERTKVRVVVDPTVDQNTHTIEAIGEFGKMELEVANNPMPANPKTSLLAALSILSVLQNTAGAVKIGS